MTVALSNESRWQDTLDSTPRDHARLAREASRSSRTQDHEDGLQGVEIDPAT